MDRRQFFRGLAGAAVAIATLDPERLLWVPGTKKIFFPPAVRLVDNKALLDEISAATIKQLRNFRVVDNFFVEEKWIRFSGSSFCGGNYVASPFSFTLSGNYSAS